MVKESRINDAENLNDFSTEDILAALKNRVDLGKHISTLTELIDIAKVSADVPNTDDHLIPDLSEKKEAHPSLMTSCRPNCQTKIFATRDATDFIQIQQPHGIGEHDEFWQKRSNEYMSGENQSPPIPCHEINFYQAFVASRIRSSEGLIAYIRGNEHRINRPFDQIIGKTLNLSDLKAALDSGAPWFSSLIQKPFPIFTLGTENAATLSNFFNTKSSLNVDVVPISASYVATTSAVEIEVREYLVNQLTNVDLANGHQLWNTNYLTDDVIRALATTMSAWLEGLAKKTYNKPMIFVKTPWKNENASNRAYLSALFGQTLLHLLYPSITKGNGSEANTDLARQLSQLPTFSTSPIRATNISMLTEKEYSMRKGYEHGSSPIYESDFEVTSVNANLIEKELIQLKGRPWEEALQQWKVGGKELLTNIK